MTMLSLDREFLQSKDVINGEIEEKSSVSASRGWGAGGDWRRSERSSPHMTVRVKHGETRRPPGSPQSLLSWTANSKCSIFGCVTVFRATSLIASLHVGLPK